MKVKLRVRTRLSLEQVLLFAALFCVCSFALLEHVSIPIPLFSYAKKPLLFLGGLCILSQAKLYVRTFLKWKFFFVHICVLLMCLLLMVSGLYNRHPSIGHSAVDSSMRTVLYILELYALMVWTAETGRGQYVLDFLFVYVLVMTIATDFLMFSRLISFQRGKYTYYLVGTKFSVSYLHLNLVSLAMMRSKKRRHGERKKKWLLFAALLFTAFVSNYVDCMTGIIGAVVLMGLHMVADMPIRNRMLRFESFWQVAGCLAISVVFPFLVEGFVSLPAVQFVIEEVLGRETHLTGRVMIFQAYVPGMSGHWLWGYGYGNGNVASEALFRCANAQNALLHWILQTGIPAVLLLVVLILVVFRQIERYGVVRQYMPMILLVYVYIILGTVETTFSMGFLLWVAVLFMLTAEKKPIKALEERGVTG